MISWLVPVVASIVAAYPGHPYPDSAKAVGTVNSFYRALEGGDSSAALRLLDREAIVLESGDIETYAEYRAHHLAADIQFAKAVKSARTIVSVKIVGEVAWVVATSSTAGSFQGRPINSKGAELMVLRRKAQVWKITAIHWSSHSLKAGT